MICHPIVFTFAPLSTQWKSLPVLCSANNFELWIPALFGSRISWSETWKFAHRPPGVLQSKLVPPPPPLAHAPHPPHHIHNTTRYIVPYDTPFQGLAVDLSTYWLFDSVLGHVLLEMLIIMFPINIFFYFWFFSSTSLPLAVYHIMIYTIHIERLYCTFPLLILFDSCFSYFEFVKF